MATGLRRVVIDSRWSAPRAFEDDVYMDWARADAFAGVFGAQEASTAWLPLLIRHRGDASTLRQQVLKLQLAIRWQDDWPVDLSVEPVWAQLSALPELAALVDRIEFSQPLAEAPQPVAAPSADVGSGGPPPAVVVGVIDSGGAPLNRAFRESDADDAPTRLLSYWDQTQAARSGPWKRPPAGYGRELDAAALKALCGRARDASQERALYLGELDMSDRAWTADQGGVDHATHVLDTLAGLPLKAAFPGAAKPALADAASRAALVLVSVPGGLPGQATGAPSALQVLDALHHIRRVARRHAPKALVVVNISLGVQAGPRDGSLLLVRAIDELMAKDPGLLVLIAAGNRGRQPMIASGSVAGGKQAEPVSVRWRLRPEDPTDSFLEAWWPVASRPDLQFRVTLPGGAPSPWVGAGYQIGWEQDGVALARLSVLASGRACLALAPVAGARRRQIPGGCWSLACRNRSDEPVPLWVMVQGDQPDFSLLPNVPVSQSYLEQARGLFLGAAGAHNVLCTGRYPISVGAGSLENQRAAWYSAPVDGKVPRPGGVHLLAAADEAVLTPGLLGAGVLSGTWVRMRGTSVAAPVAARQIVNALAEGPRPSRAEQWRQALGIVQAKAYAPLPVLRPDEPWILGEAVAQP